VARAVPHRPAIHGALLAVQILFATLSVVAKPVFHEMAPWGFTAIRACAAAVVLWAIAFARGKWRVPPRDLARIAGLAALGIAANQLVFIEGLSRTTATMALVLGTIIPVFTVAMAIVVGAERARAAALAGVGLGLCGALVVIGPTAGHRSELIGDLLIITSSCAYSMYLVLGRGVLQRVDSMVFTTWVLTFGALMILPFGASAAISAAPQVSWETWARIAWIVAGATVGTYTLNSWALGRAPASLVAIYVYVQPIVGAALAAVMLGETVSLTTVAGGVLIAAGIAVVARR
jgi:drug/metabolite transporter (DMT)-like permease